MGPQRRGPSRAARPGDKPNSVGRPQAARCAPRSPRLTPTPRGDRRSPALLLPHQLLGPKLQGGGGIVSVNMTALTKKCHGPRCVRPGLWGGRYVCLDPMHIVTAAELLSKAMWGAGVGLKEDCNLQTGRGWAVLPSLEEDLSFKLRYNLSNL